jgi:hypothetical protein
MRFQDHNPRTAARDRFPDRASEGPVAVNQQYFLKSAHAS